MGRTDEPETSPERHDDDQGDDGALQEALADAGLFRDNRWGLQEKNTPKINSRLHSAPILTEPNQPISHSIPPPLQTLNPAEQKPNNTFIRDGTIKGNR